jgi:hypothetical protein
MTLAVLLPTYSALVFNTAFDPTAITVVLVTVAPIVRLTGLRVAVFVVLATTIEADVVTALTVLLPIAIVVVLAITFAPTATADTAEMFAEKSASPTTVRPFSALNLVFAMCYLT